MVLTWIRRNHPGIFWGRPATHGFDDKKGGERVKVRFAPPGGPGRTHVVVDVEPRPEDR